MEGGKRETFRQYITLKLRSTGGVLEEAISRVCVWNTIHRRCPPLRNKESHGRAETRAWLVGFFDAAVFGSLLARAAARDETERERERKGKLLFLLPLETAIGGGGLVPVEKKLPPPPGGATGLEKSSFFFFFFLLAPGWLWQK